MSAQTILVADDDPAILRLVSAGAGGQIDAVGIVQGFGIGI